MTECDGIIRRVRRFAATSAVCAACVAALAGCGGRPSLSVEELRLDRSAWDSLTVHGEFTARSLFGRAQPATADSVTVTLFSARYDTVFFGGASGGPNGALPVSVVFDDWHRESEERLLLEWCGVFSGASVCGQTGFAASEKRIVVDAEVDYPYRDNLDRGRYRLSARSERRRFDSEDWEEWSDGGRLTGHLLVRVDSTDDEGVRVPFRAGSGSFEVARYPGYRAYRRALLSELLFQNEADVIFEVHADRFGLLGPLAADTLVVRTKNRQTRDLEAGFFAEAAGRILLDELRMFPVGRDRYVYMGSWRFDEPNDRYEIQLDVAWQSGFLRDRWFRLRGRLDVGEDGSDAVFLLSGGNDRALRRWRSRVDEERLGLGSLQTRPDSTGNARETF